MSPLMLAAIRQAGSPADADAGGGAGDGGGGGGGGGGGCLALALRLVQAGARLDATDVRARDGKRNLRRARPQPPRSSARPARRPICPPSLPPARAHSRTHIRPPARTHARFRFELQTCTCRQSGRPGGTRPTAIGRSAAYCDRPVGRGAAVRCGRVRSDA